MALEDPNPDLATERITVNGRTLTDDLSGGQRFVGGATADYPAIVTMKQLNQQGLVNRAGTTLAEALWDILIFTTDDPGVMPQKTKILVQGQNRQIIATLPSTKRESGCWYVLGKSFE